MAPPPLTFAKVPPLPIEAVLPELVAALRTKGRAVLQAPPGAGKTTRVPLALLENGIGDGRIVMLEPRRLAARAAAERMAETLGEPVGKTVGYRMRGDAKVSKSTKIEVVTEGILARMIQSDPGLDGIGVLIFDEFHERSLNADLGLALAWEARGALREDLVIVVMSATFDAEPVAEMLDNAPLVTSKGQSFPVDTQWLDRPTPREARWEATMAALVRQAVAETDGGVLAFCPGEGEIRRLQSALTDLGEVAVMPLFGALPFEQQRAAVAPLTGRRKLVLATAIAETALTIQDVSVVVDGGLARRARFDPGRGMSRLVTERVTKAEATQRTGRAGRVGPGHCYRHWTRGEEGGLFAFPPPEIAAADLSGLVLELSLWGTSDPSTLGLLTQPPDRAWREASELLKHLGALDAKGRITPHGRAIAAMPLHPRLAHMLALAGRNAAPLAALLNEPDPLRGMGADLNLRLKALARPQAFGKSAGALRRISSEAKRLGRLASDRVGLSAGEMAALAYPDRIGLRRPGDDPRFLLSGGTGAQMDPQDTMAGQRLVVAVDKDGKGREPKIRMAAGLSEAELRSVHANGIVWEDRCEWSRRERAVIARRQERFGAIVLNDRRWDDPPPDAMALAVLEGVRDLGLPWSTAARRLQARIEFCNAEGAGFADFSDDALLDDAEDWLLPYLTGVQNVADLRAFDPLAALQARLGWDAKAKLDKLAPAKFETPLGRSISLEYQGDAPSIDVRLQEMFGVTTHPVVGPRRLPLKISLLSPAGRPVAVTTDLPGFWSGTYADVRKDMRGRYPKHPWPEDPANAAPTVRAKPRGT